MDAGTLTVTLRLNGGDISGGGPYVTGGPVEIDQAPRYGTNGPTPAPFPILSHTSPAERR